MSQLEKLNNQNRDIAETQIKERKEYANLRSDYDRLNEEITDLRQDHTDLAQEYSEYKARATEEQEQLSTSVADMQSWVLSDVSFFSSFNILPVNLMAFKCL